MFLSGMGVLLCLVKSDGIEYTIRFYDGGYYDKTHCGKALALGDFCLFFDDWLFCKCSPFYFCQGR